MAEPPPWPPPDPTRPFDWETDDVEWDDGPRKLDERVGLLLVVLAMIALGIGFYLLFTIH